MEAKTIEFQRWTAKRKAELVMELVRGTEKLVDVCREQDLKQSEVESWIQTFLQGGEKALKVNAEDEQAAHEKEAGSDRPRKEVPPTQYAEKLAA